MLTALMFFPRGGSAHVARALARELPAHGWDVTVVSGSLPGHGDAERFYEGCDVHAVRFDRGDAPMHPSYEDRPDAPDRVFAAVDDDAYEGHVDAWSRALEEAGAADADVLHLHHLTPIHEAAARVAPDVPVVGHLHGTELLMLERIAEGPPAGWDHAEAWERRMRRWAQRCERLLLLSRSQLERAERLLGIDPRRCVDRPQRLRPRALRAAHRRPRRVLAPARWSTTRAAGGPGHDEGSVAYRPEQAAAVAERARPAVRRPLHRGQAHGPARCAPSPARARRCARAAAASLVLVGGYPGEWEGEHPYDAIRATGARDVFLAGWHEHEELPEFFAAADAVVLASVREQFGSVLVEGMACGLPAIAVDRFGPADIVRPGQTGLAGRARRRGGAGRRAGAGDRPPDERRRRGRGRAPRRHGALRVAGAGRAAVPALRRGGRRPPTTTRPSRPPDS